MRSLFLSKVPVNEPLQVPQQGPYGERCPSCRAFLYTSFRIPSKGTLPPGFPRREMPLSWSSPSFIFQRPRYTSPLPCSPTGPLWREMPVSRASLYTFSRVPSKGPPPPFRFRTADNWGVHEFSKNVGAISQILGTNRVTWSRYRMVDPNFCI